MSVRSLAFWFGMMTLFAPRAFAKGDNEFGFLLSYFDRQYEADGQKVKQVDIDFSGLYLTSLKSFWSGIELSYGTSRSSIVGTSSLKLGVPFKYWMKGPESKGIGIYAVATPYLGRVDSGDGGDTLLGLTMGPGIAYFLSDMVSVDTKLYYDYRRVGSSPWVTTGLMVGISTYF